MAYVGVSVGVPVGEGVDVSVRVADGEGVCVSVLASVGVEEGDSTTGTSLTATTTGTVVGAAGF
jgi:hypothetical protein